jgi:ATP-binding cassette subfamily C protein
MQKIPLLEFKKFPPSYLNSRINQDSNNLAIFFINNFPAIITNSLKFIISLFIILTIDLNVFIAMLIFAPIYILAYLNLQKPIFKKNTEFLEQQNIYFNTVNSQFETNEVIKVDVGFELSENLILNQYHKLLHKILSLNKFFALLNGMDNIIIFIYQSIFLIYFSLKVMNGKSTIGNFLLIQTYFMAFVGTLKYYINYTKEYHKTKSSYIRVKELLDMEIEPVGNFKIESIDSLSVNNVAFSFNELAGNQCNIRFKNLEFIKNRIYCITGRNGAGKTTLLNIVIGIYNNYKGVVKYGPKSLAEIDIYDLRKNKISVALQKPRFENTTVFENLNQVIEIKDSDGLLRLIKGLNIENLYLSTSFDIREHIFKSISELSGGELQKVSILRALLKNSGLLILDEPSTAMDKSSTYELLNIIKSLKNDKIIIIISHDYDFIEIADEIIEIDAATTG